MLEMNEEPSFLTLEEVAATLRVSKRTIHRMIKQNKLPAFKVGGQWRIAQNRFKQWVHQKEVLISRLNPE
jgi:excisionase family DNA binding protein